MSIEKSRKGDEREQLKKVRSRKSQAKTESQSVASTHELTAEQSVEKLNQAKADFETFQAAIAAQLSAMQQATIATARQAAEIKNSMPLLFEQEFAARDAELRGERPAGFPVPTFEPVAEFTIPTPQLGSAAGAQIAGTDNAAGQRQLEAAD